MLLSRYDFSSGSAFNQWIRSYNSNWGTASGGHSGSFQEFRWADRYNNDTVTIQDLTSIGGCNGLSASTGATTGSCPDHDSLGPIFSHWQKTTFEGSGVIKEEVTLVASHLDDTWVYPFSWSNDQVAQPGQTLDNITPWT